MKCEAFLWCGYHICSVITRGLCALLFLIHSAKSEAIIVHNVIQSIDTVLLLKKVGCFVQVSMGSSLMLETLFVLYNKDILGFLAYIHDCFYALEFDTLRPFCHGR